VSCIGACHVAYATGGYKGYGLAMMVELFCGVLGGADFGPNVRQMSDRTKPVNLVRIQLLFTLNSVCVRSTLL
jgi:LDH2 family malate/lactate/ureidoglycolate dehydrogenase